MRSIGAVVRRGPRLLARLVPRSRRARLLLAAVAALAALLAGGGWATVSASRSAEREVRALADEARALSLPQLLEPATYVGLAETSARAETAAARLRSRLAWLGPLGPVPWLGARLRAARNTADVGANLASASVRILAAYGDAVADRRIAGADGVTTALSAKRDALMEARAALDRAASALGRPTLLPEDDLALVRGGVGFLRALTVIAIESPAVIDDAVALLEGVNALQALLTQPLTALLDVDRVGDLIESLRTAAGSLEQEAARLAGQPGAPAESLGLLGSAAGAARALAEAGGALVGVTSALDRGFLSPAFGVEAGRLLAEASRSTDEALTLLADLERGLASGATGAGAPGDVQAVLAPAHDAIEQVSTTTQALRSFLGYQAPQTYLLVLQNQNEIRATGGFLGAVAEVRLLNGVLGELVYVDSTRVDPLPLINNPIPPEPLYWYLWMGRLLFRDANWNPHFPESARTLLGMYAQGRGVQAQGVIGVTKQLGLELVDILGTVRVPELDVVLTTALANAYAEGLAPYPCRPRHVSDRGKRCFDEDLAPAVLDALRTGLDGSKRAAFVQVVEAHLRRKGILVYSGDRQVAALLRERHWDGAVPQDAQDLLMVVDSSLPGHTTADIGRTWDYRVRLVPGGISQATLRVRYENVRSKEVADCRQAEEGGGGCYWNFMRVYLPPAARQVQVTPIPLHEGSEKLIWGHRELDSRSVTVHAGAGLRGLTEVGGYVVVEPGSVLTVPISYELGPGIVQASGPKRFAYRLILVKQPGMDRDIVRLRVVLPSGGRVVASSLAGVTAVPDGAAWQGSLAEDMEVVVIFEVP